MSKREVVTYPDSAAIAAAAADEFARIAPKTVALSGGSTPRALYELLAERTDIAWRDIQFFWGDERHVGPEDADSNYRMAHEAMLAHVPVPEAHIHRVKGENPDAAAAAADYERVLRDVFGAVAGGAPSPATVAGIPRFDLVLLGMGPDGHTASLFPGTSAVTERAALVTAPFVPKMHGYRITMTLPVLNNAANVIFMVGGAEKATVLREILGNTGDPQFPAAMVLPTDGRLLWMIDEAAAGRTPLKA